jgi:AcrR family transcriptional regulator
VYGSSPTTKADQSEPSTSALIACARELFATRGYEAVDIEQIIEHAGSAATANDPHSLPSKRELLRAVLIRISAETAKRIANAMASAEDPWEALLRGSDAFLDACATAEVKQVVMIDGPAVLGWDLWRAMETQRSFELTEAALRRAIEARRVIPQPAGALAQVLLGALHEAGLIVAGAEDQEAARAEMGRSVHHLLEGLRAPTL